VVGFQRRTVPREVQPGERVEHRRRCAVGVHRACDRIHEPRARAVDLVGERDALQVSRIVVREAPGVVARARELAAQCRADRRPMLGWIVKQGAVRWRRMHARAEEEDALLPPDGVTDEVQCTVRLGPFPHHRASIMPPRIPDS
jgi:hypothetical protein